MVEVPEYVVNVKLAEIISSVLGIDARAERVKKRKRPDIRCYYNGLIIGIEASYSASDAEKDAIKRIDEGLADIVIALHLKTRYRDVSEKELEELIKRSRFDVKIFVPREVGGTLIPYIENVTKLKADSTEWFRDVDLPFLKTIIENVVSFIVEEREVQMLIKELRKVIDDFTQVLKVLDKSAGNAYSQGIADILYRLYGMKTYLKHAPEILFGHAALSILLSTVFYEYIRARHPNLKPVTEHTRRIGYIEGLKEAFSELLEIDYKVALETTIEILKILPHQMEGRIKTLVDLALKIVSNRTLLRRDFAGRVYHEITGDIALRKGFATFFTEVPAAYLLSTLATSNAIGLDNVSVTDLDRNDAVWKVERIKDTKVADFACGSGTLLTASYYSLTRYATALKYYYDLDDVDIDEIGRILIENNIYGIDALRYATQITAINLALIGPNTVKKENIYTIYLGYIKGMKRPWLGSLELLRNGEKVTGILRFLEGIKAEKVSLDTVEGTYYIPEKFDVVIMNPPFTRATGRTSRFEESAGERGLFGFITDKATRALLLKHYNEIRNQVRDDLLGIAVESKELFPDIVKKIVVDRPRELRQFLSIGQAGEGLLFLYLAHKYLRGGGIMAFVLPRAVLAGVSWFLARVLLASKYDVKYVVVSVDPVRGYNFSEGTSLSETLIVAKKTNGKTEDNETVFVMLLKKPTTALGGLMLAEKIKEFKRTGKRYETIEAGNSVALVLRTDKRSLLNNVDNWNRFVAIPDPVLLNEINKIINENKIEIDDSIINIKLKRLNELLDTLGIDRHEFHDNFTASKTLSPYPIVYSGKEELRSRMKVAPNMYAHPKTDRGVKLFNTFAGKVLLPDRIWWDTAHAVALYSEEPVLSNIFYVARLNVPEEIREYAEKALVLWLNTTWGILTILINRQETRGRWTSLKMAQWRMLPVLDIASLDTDTLRELARVYDSYSTKRFERIPHQFNPAKPDPNRLNLDLEFLKALKSDIDEEAVKKYLITIYKNIYEAFRRWIS